MNLINTRESGSNKYLNIKKKFSHDWLGIFLPILSLWSKYIYVYVWLVSLHCSPETVTALLIIYNPIQNKKLKKKKEKKVSVAAAVAAAAAKSLQSCPTLCDPRDGSPPGSPVPGILQARTLEWVAISFSNAWKWKVKVKSLSRVRLLATP